MTKRDRLLLRIIRTVFIVAIGLFFLTMPFRMPDASIHNWGGNLILIGTGLMLLYVEYSLWHSPQKADQRRDN